MRRRLFLKVYLTLIAALAIVAVASAAFVRLGDHEMSRGLAGQRDRFLAAMLPPGDGPAALRLVLERLGRAFEADITVFDTQRRPIASVGR